MDAYAHPELYRSQEYGPGHYGLTNKSFLGQLQTLPDDHWVYVCSGVLFPPGVPSHAIVSLLAGFLL